MARTKTITTDDILLVLCDSVKSVLATATNHPINYSAMVQKINKTCLKPDLGCFVLFDGGFSGLVIINFTAQAAIEIYQNYMLHMGIPENESNFRDAVNFAIQKSVSDGTYSKLYKKWFGEKPKKLPEVWPN